MKRVMPKIIIVAGAIFISLGLLAEDKSWFRKIIPKKEPQVLAGKNEKPLIEPPAAVMSLQDSFAKVAEVAKPAVVNISAVQITKVQSDPSQFYYGDPEDFFYKFFGGQGPSTPRQREYRTEGTGSGVLIDPDGYLLTNNHVVQGATQLTVTLESGRSYKGVVVGSDPRTDLAVVKLKGSTPFKYLPLGDSSSMRVGDWVIAVGSPFGLQQTVTAGIVSARRQSLNIEGKQFHNMIQTDAAINRGNSGGPLINLRGEVIGINSAIYAPTGTFAGIGFAIPVNDAKKIIRDLIDKGFVERSWMGVEIADVDDVLAQQFGLSSPEGSIVNSIIPKSPAEKAGLERGDVITEVNGDKVTNSYDLQNIITAFPPNTTIKLKVIRNGRSRMVSLTTEALPREGEEAKKEKNEESAQKPEEAKWLGAAFINASPEARDTFQIPKDIKTGVVVADVPPDSVAAEVGLVEGDLVQSVDRKEIKDVGDLKRIGDNLDLKKGVVMNVWRHGRWFYLTYKSLQ